VETRKLGSSAARRERAMPIFSWSALVFGSTATSMTGVRELHPLEDDRRVGRAERVAGGRVLEADQRDDVAGIGLLDVLAVVRVHQQHAADLLLLVLDGVEDGAALSSLPE
jgi:hypothetical protein